MKRKNTFFRNGTFYTITNRSNQMALAMPFTENYLKDKPILQPIDKTNKNQIWMIEEVQPKKFEIVHAVSTLVLTNIPNSRVCKLQFGKQKNNQLFHLEVINVNDSVYSAPKKEQKMEESERSMIKVEVNQQLTKTRLTRIAEAPLNKKRIMFRIRQNQKSHKYLFCKKQYQRFYHKLQQNHNKADENVDISFMEVDLSSYQEESIWQFQRIEEGDNNILDSTCVIASLGSGYALDVPEASQKKGIQIIQYSINFRFNQRWILKKINPEQILVQIPGHHLPVRVISQEQAQKYNFYMIMNAKTKLFLDIKGQSTKQGTPIIQWGQNGGRNQIWRLQQQGKRTYIIRSVMDYSLVLGIKDNSLKQETNAVTVSNNYESDNMWMIYGKIPK